MLTFDEYQERTGDTNIYSKRISDMLAPLYRIVDTDTPAGLEATSALAGTEVTLNLAYTALGLAGEAAEVANKVKKLIRDGKLPDGTAEEIGDVLWYCSQFLAQLNRELSEVAQENLYKLSSRKERGALGGSGDKR